MSIWNRPLTNWAVESFSAWNTRTIIRSYCILTRSSVLTQFIHWCTRSSDRTLIHIWMKSLIDSSNSELPYPHRTQFPAILPCTCKYKLLVRNLHKFLHWHTERKHMPCSLKNVIRNWNEVQLSLTFTVVPVVGWVTRTSIAGSVALQYSVYFEIRLKYLTALEQLPPFLHGVK